jgi:D-alanyl-D-alanine carboxypeptidase
MMSGSIAAVQARISAIEQSFAPPPRAVPTGTTRFADVLATAEADALATTTPASGQLAAQGQFAAQGQLGQFTPLGQFGPVGQFGGLGQLTAPGPVTAPSPIAGVAPAGQSPTAQAPTAVYSTEMGPAGPPPELAAYGNGRIPAEALASVEQGTHRLWAPAAAAFQQMEEAATRDGVAFRVSDSYRSYDQQVTLAERKGLYSEGGLAARPGTSNHGWGRSLDLDTNGGAVEWLRANAARFGFHEDVPREPWHWTFRPAH